MKTFLFSFPSCFFRFERILRNSLTTLCFLKVVSTISLWKFDVMVTGGCPRCKEQGLGTRGDLASLYMNAFCINSQFNSTSYVFHVVVNKEFGTVCIRNGGKNKMFVSEQNGYKTKCFRGYKQIQTFKSSKYLWVSPGKSGHLDTSSKLVSYLVNFLIFQFFPNVLIFVFSHTMKSFVSCMAFLLIQ